MPYATYNTFTEANTFVTVADRVLNIGRRFYVVRKGPCVYEVWEW